MTGKIVLGLFLAIAYFNSTSMLGGNGSGFFARWDSLRSV